MRKIKWTKEYPLEVELEKLFRELRRLVVGIRKFFFTIPKNKMDKWIYLVETLSWLLLGLALILRSGRW
jgi:hypothetical protein